MGGEKRRHHVAAFVTQEGEWNQHEPNTGFAKMFIAMLILHVLIIGGIILSDSGTKKMPPRSPAAQAVLTKSSNELSTTLSAPSTHDAVNGEGEKYETYEVRSGDSLPMIVARFGVDKDELIALNGLEGSEFGAGRVLKIPAKKIAAPLQISAARPLPNIGLVPPTSTPSAPVEQQPAPADTLASVNPSVGETPSTDTSAPPEKNSALTMLAPNAGSNDGLIPLPEVGSLPPATEPVVEKKVVDSPPPASSKPAVSKTDSVASPEREKPAPKKVASSPPRPVPPPSEMTKRPISKGDSPPKTATKTTGKTGGAYVMAKGDTLYRVSAKYGVSVESIMKANSIKDPAKLRDGTKLVIPAK